MREDSYHPPVEGETSDHVMSWILVVLWLLMLVLGIMDAVAGNWGPLVATLALPILVIGFPLFMMWSSRRWERKSRAKHPDRWY
jgi:hypothetical protein